MLPPFGLSAVLTHWQFAPVVTAFAAASAALYGWGVVRVARRHPARPWPAWRTAMFLGGLAVLVLANHSGVGAYFHILFLGPIDALLVLSIGAPPLLIFGRPLPPPLPPNPH